MQQPEALSRLIAAIYDAALDRDCWPDTLRDICRFVGGSGALVLIEDIIDRQASHVFNHGFEPALVTSYVEKYVHLNPLPRIGFSRPIGDIITIDDLMTRAEFEATTFYQEWVKPQDLVDIAAVMIEKTATGFAVLFIRRGRDHGLVDEKARRWMALIMPHVRRSMQIGRVISGLERRSEAFSQTVSALSSAVLMVDAERRVLFRNEAATTMIEGGRVVHPRSDVLMFRDSVINKDLSLAITQATVSPEAGKRKTTTREFEVTEAGRWMMQIVPIESSERDFRQPVASVFITRIDLELDNPLRMISRAYGLTLTETRILRAVVEVGGSPAIASAIGIGEGTVKSHLKSLFQKTGTHRQADLVRLVASYSSPLDRG
jgi:DNA-binding CsgD family transcriptional regulator